MPNPRDAGVWVGAGVLPRRCPFSAALLKPEQGMIVHFVREKVHSMGKKVHSVREIVHSMGKKVHSVRENSRIPLSRCSLQNSGIQSPVKHGRR